MKIFLLSGEPSGDLYASLVVRAIKELDPKVEIRAVGGKELAETPVARIRDNQDLGVVGFYEGMKSSFRLYRIKERLKKEIIAFAPDIFLPISFSGFSLPLSRELKKEGIKIIYLSPPQIWAWGKRRVSFLKRYVDKIICLFPFEVEFYRWYSLPAFYFGNPLLELTQPFLKDAEEVRERAIAFAPGSRREEMKRHFPFLKEIFSRLNKNKELLGFFLLLPNLLSAKVKEDKEVIFVSEKRYEIIARSELVVGKLGTIALESVLLGKPYVGVYLPSLPTYFWGKFLVRTQYFSLPNLILKEKVFPEFIRPKPEEVEGAIRTILENKENKIFYQRKALKVREVLNEKEPTRRIAEAILN